MLKFGYIKDVDAAKGTARVVFDGDDNMVSAPLRIAVKRSKEDKEDIDFDVDEHVACMMDEQCEEGVILCAIYSDTETPSNDAGKGIMGITFRDGARIEYNRLTSKYKIDVGTSGEIDFKCNKLSVDGKIEATGEIKSATDVKALTVSLLNHIHPYVNVTTPATTSAPTP